MKIRIFYIILFTYGITSAQLGINTDQVDDSAIFEAVSTDKGILIPRISEMNRLAINNPANSLLVYQIDEATGFWYYDVDRWRQIEGSGWLINGNNGTNDSINFAGTTDATSFSIITNDVNRITINENQKIGIGTDEPLELLHLKGSGSLLRIEDGNENDGYYLTSDDDGDVRWSDPDDIVNLDNDWRFVSGETVNDEVYRVGPTVIGRTGDTTHLLDVDNGNPTGTTIGIGNEEKIIDGDNETQFSHHLIPSEDNSIALGSAAARWSALYTTNGVIQTSDNSLKEDITVLEYGIKEIMQLHPVQYNWKDQHNTYDKEVKLGLIAQEVHTILPEVVVTNGFVNKSTEEQVDFQRVEYDVIGIKYESLLPVLVKARQNQQERIQILLEQTAQLKAKILQLKP